MAIHINSPEQFTNEVLNFFGVVLVDFYADRCGPCRMLAPIIDQLAEQYAQQSQVKIVKVNVDDNPQIAAQYGITSIPTVFIFKNGAVQYKEVGVQTKQSYEAKIQSLL